MSDFKRILFSMARPSFTLKSSRKYAQRMAQRFEQSENDYFDEVHNVGKIRYYIDGPADAPITVIFIHGYTLAAKAWHMQVGHIHEHARCVMMDYRGHGHADNYRSDECSIDGAADDVWAVIQDAQITGPILLVAHSLGGMVTFNLVRRYPEIKKDLKGVIVVSTAVDSFTTQGMPQILASPIVGKIHEAAEASPEGAANFKQSLANIVAPFLATTMFRFGTPREIVEFHAELINKTPLKTLVGYLDDLQHHDEYAGVAALNGIPGVVIVGDNDRVTPVEQSERIVSIWMDAGLQIVPGAGHMVPLETPWIIDKAMDELIEKTVGADCANAQEAARAEGTSGTDPVGAATPMAGEPRAVAMNERSPRDAFGIQTGQ